jgi:hypothetical protein
MSKSIPASSINVGDPATTIVQKIENGLPENDPVLLAMMRQASSWNRYDIAAAEQAYDARAEHPEGWAEIKRNYSQHFLAIAEHWQAACEAYPLPERKPQTAPNGRDASPLPAAAL